MNYRRRFPALLLVLILALSAVLVSCRTSGGGDKDSGSGNNSGQESDGKYHSTAPVKDYKGATFTVGGIDPNIYSSMILDFDFEENPQDTVQSAVYKRNRIVEDIYKVKFVNEYIGYYTETPGVLDNMVGSDDSKYQLIMLVQRDALSRVISGYAMAASEIPYLDFDQPWYISKMNDSFNADGIQLLAYTDSIMNAYMQTICVFFNMGMISENPGLENPYELVDKGSWTIEKFYSMCSMAMNDVNADSEYNVADGDVFGVVGEFDSFYPSVWIGSGLKAISVDRRGQYSFSASGNEKFIDVVSKLSDVVNTPGMYCSSTDQFSDRSSDGDVMRDAGTKYFSTNGALFRIGCVGYIQLMRDMEADFGVMPLPKYDESQSEYLTRTCDGWIHIVPNTTGQNRELLGTMIDSLGAESRNQVIPAFFETTLNYKLIRDEDKPKTQEMLDIIFNNATMDLGDTFIEIFTSPIMKAITDGNGNFSSTIGMLESSVNQYLRETQEKIADLKGQLGQ